MKGPKPPKSTKPPATRGMTVLASVVDSADVRPPWLFSAVTCSCATVGEAIRYASAAAGTVYVLALAGMTHVTTTNLVAVLLRLPVVMSMSTWLKPEPVQLMVSGWVRLMLVSELKFVTLKLAGNVAGMLNGPTCGPPAPASVYVAPFTGVMELL